MHLLFTNIFDNMLSIIFLILVINLIYCLNKNFSDLDTETIVWIIMNIILESIINIFWLIIKVSQIEITNEIRKIKCMFDVIIWLCMTIFGLVILNSYFSHDLYVTYIIISLLFSSTCRVFNHYIYYVYRM